MESRICSGTNAATRQTVAWLMNGLSATSFSVLLTNPDWKITATPDLNGDGKSDLLWYNAVSGQTVAWLMDGLSPTSYSLLLSDLNWKITATPDLNGDGKSDLLWYNAATGQTVAC
jgi:isocitrate dehydrogenase